MKLHQTKSILHVVISLEIGGLERFVLDLIGATQNNFSQLIVCLGREGELADKINVEVISLGMEPGVHLGVAQKISRIVREKQVDIIHTHNEKAQLYGALAGLLSGVPVLHTKHGINDTNWRSILRNKFVSCLCRKIVTVSNDAAMQCVHYEKVSSSKVVTILNGIDYNRFPSDTSKEESKNKIGIDADTLVIGIVARLAPVKDHATLFESCRILLASGHNFKLLVVGDGPLRDCLVEQTLSLGISNQVIFTGMRNDISNLMSAMDIFVLSSLSEGISLTLLEAMASRLPIVATAVGGNPEVVVNAKTGFLVEPNSPVKMSKKLEILLSNKALRNEMGSAGRARVIDCFSLQKSAIAYQKLYTSILK